MPFHVTLARLVPRIMRQGLMPQAGERSAVMEDPEGIYLFKTQLDAENAVQNWLGEEFDDMENLALLEVTLPPDAKILPSTADYEIIVASPIPPGYIELVSENF
jgi:hypothetical protein